MKTLGQNGIDASGNEGKTVLDKRSFYLKHANFVFPCAPVSKSDMRSAGSLTRRFRLFIFPSEAWIAAQVQFCRWGCCNRIVSKMIRSGENLLDAILSCFCVLQNDRIEIRRYTLKIDVLPSSSSVYLESYAFFVRVW